MALNLNVDPTKLGNTLGAVGSALSGASGAIAAQNAQSAATSGLSSLSSQFDIGGAAVGGALGAGAALAFRRSAIAGGLLGAVVGGVLATKVGM